MGNLDAAAAGVDATAGADAPVIARRRRSRPGPALVPVIASLVFSFAFISRSCMRIGGRPYFSLFDDAMISMRFARNLAEGHGLVWNAGGAHVEGYTNLSWTLWMAVLQSFGIPERYVSLAVMLSGALLLVINVALVGKIARAVAPDSERVAVISMWVTVFCYPLVYWTLRGMEVGLVTTLISAAIVIALDIGGDDRPRHCLALGAVLSALVLTRDDTIVISAILVGYACLVAPRAERVRVAATTAALPFAAVVVHELFRGIYYGDVLPNTYRLKVSNVPLSDRVSRGLTAVGNFGIREAFILLVLAAVAVVACRRKEVWLLGAVVGGQLLYCISVGGDAWEYLRFADRYVAVVEPQLVVLAAIGAMVLVSRARNLYWMAFGLGVLIVGALLALVQPLPLELIRLARNTNTTIPGVRLLFVSGALVFLATRLRSRVLVPLIVVGLVVGSFGLSLDQWKTRNAVYAQTTDRKNVIDGLAIRAYTTDGATVAVVSAGAVTYFSHRPTVDLLGKSDRHVASGPSRAKPFWPGHSKWDYEYSICQLRPDFVDDLFKPEPGDVPMLTSCGYHRIGRTRKFVRNDSQLVIAEKPFGRPIEAPPGA